MDINKTKILLFVVAYMLFVTLTTIYYSINFFIEYLQLFKFGFVLTKAGVSIITPLIPLVRLILGLIGLAGAIFLLIGKKKGLWISICWAIIQIPAITITFEKATKIVLLGLSSINLQKYFAGPSYCSSEVYKSAFTKTTSILTKCIGINFVGVIILFLLTIIWLQNNQKALIYLKVSSNKFRRYLLRIIQSGVVLMLIGVVFNSTMQNWMMKPNVSIEVADVTFPVDVNFVGENNKVEMVIANVNTIFRNKGKSPTTIEKLYLKIRIFPLIWRLWMPDTSIYGTYYPGGCNEGSVSGLLQKKIMGTGTF